MADTLNDKVYAAQKKRVEKIFFDWRDLMGLNKHRFDLIYDRSYCSDNNAAVAEISALWQYKHHSVTFFMPKIVEIDDDEELEESIVHELTHVLVHPVAGSNGSKSDAEIEKVEYATTSIAMALIWARNEGRK